LRGLGIGIFLTALLMGARDGEGASLSDAEIKARAAKLGMVESDSLRLSEIGDVTPMPGQSAAPSVGNGGKTDAPPVQTPTTEPKADSTATPETGTTEPVTALPTDQIPEEDGMVTVVIESGEIAAEISQKLAEAGLVEDAAAFEVYLCELNYTRIIRDGTYKIPLGTSREAIVEMITGFKPGAVTASPEPTQEPEED